jgi:hypothetical protein
MNQTKPSALLDYHYWARNRVLDAVRPLPAEQLRPIAREQLRIHPCHARPHLRSRMDLVFALAGHLANSAGRAETYPDVTLSVRLARLEPKIRAYSSLGEDGLTLEFDYNS